MVDGQFVVASNGTAAEGNEPVPIPEIHRLGVATVDHDGAAVSETADASALEEDFLQRDSGVEHARQKSNTLT